MIAQRMTGYLSSRLVCEAAKMSMLSAAAMLDELMGVDRNRAPNEKKLALHWSDPQVIFTRHMSLYELFLLFILVPSVWLGYRATQNVN